MVWREQVGHHSDCYFCMSMLSGFSQKNKFKMVYSDLKPVLHNLGIPVPTPPAKSGIENKGTCKSSVSFAASSTNEMYVADVDEKKPHLLSQLG